MEHLIKTVFIRQQWKSEMPMETGMSRVVEVANRWKATPCFLLIGTKLESAVRLLLLGGVIK